jgi:hypothetical protein
MPAYNREKNDQVASQQLLHKVTKSRNKEYPVKRESQHSINSGVLLLGNNAPVVAAATRNAQSSNKQSLRNLAQGVQVRLPMHDVVPLHLIIAAPSRRSHAKNQQSSYK